MVQNLVEQKTFANDTGIKEEKNLQLLENFKPLEVIQGAIPAQKSDAQIIKETAPGFVAKQMVDWASQNIGSDNPSSFYSLSQLQKDLVLSGTMFEDRYRYTSESIQEKLFEEATGLPFNKETAYKLYFDTLEQNEDFAELSKPSESPWYDLQHRYVNDINGFRQTLLGRAYDYGEDYRNSPGTFLFSGTPIPMISAWKSMVLNESRNSFSLMDETQIARYNYLYNKYGKQGADKYLNYIEKELNEKQAAMRTVDNRKFAIAYKDKASLLSLLNTVAAVPGVAIDMLEQYGRKAITGESIDYHSPLMQDFRRGADWTSAVSESIESPAARFAYDLTISCANSAVALAVGTMVGGPAGTAITTFILGSTAGINAAYEAHEKGASDEQALAIGLASGIAEAVFEKLSIGKFNFFKSIPDISPSALVHNVTTQVLVNASEEMATEISNIITDYLIMGGLSDYEEAVERYIAEGKSPEEANTFALREMAARVSLSGLGGAIMGFGLSSASTSMAYNGNANAGAALRAEGATDSVLQSGLSYGMDTANGKLAAKLDAKRTAGQNLRDAELGALLRMNQQAEAAGIPRQAIDFLQAKEKTNIPAQYFTGNTYLRSYIKDGVLYLHHAENGQANSESIVRDYAAFALSQTMKENGTYNVLAQNILQNMNEHWVSFEQHAMSESLKNLGIETTTGDLTENIVNQYIADHLFENFADVLELASTDYALAGHIYDGIRSIPKESLTPQLRDVVTQAEDNYARVLAHFGGKKTGISAVEKGELMSESKNPMLSNVLDSLTETGYNSDGQIGEHNGGVTQTQDTPYQTSPDGTDNSIKHGKINIQFFAEKDIQNQKSISLQRALRKFEREIALHRDKIDNPQNYAVDWEDKDIREQEGLIRHWEKEINNFQKSIEERIAELKRRGDYDE